MTRICATCQCVYGLTEGKAGLSHGACPACYPRILAEFGLGPKPYPYPTEKRADEADVREGGEPGSHLAGSLVGAELA